MLSVRRCALDSALCKERGVASDGFEGSSHGRLRSARRATEQEARHQVRSDQLRKHTTRRTRHGGDMSAILCNDKRMRE